MQVQNVKRSPVDGASTFTESSDEREVGTLQNANDNGTFTAEAPFMELKNLGPLVAQLILASV